MIMHNFLVNTHITRIEPHIDDMCDSTYEWLRKNFSSCITEDFFGLKVNGIIIRGTNSLETNEFYWTYVFKIYSYVHESTEEIYESTFKTYLLENCLDNNLLVIFETLKELNILACSNNCDNNAGKNATYLTANPPTAWFTHIK